MTDMEVENMEAGSSLGDKFIAFLTALVFGATGWATLYGLVAGINYAGNYFEIDQPDSMGRFMLFGQKTMIVDLPMDIINILFLYVPILFGLLVYWRSYKLVLKLE